MTESSFHIAKECFFEREQLIDQDYDPIANGIVDLDDLKERFAHHVVLDHAAAVRGILVKDPDEGWFWIWGIGLLHDQILEKSGYSTLYARFRNQLGMLPRIEFTAGAEIETGLNLLLEKTSIEAQDMINIESERGGRWMSIQEYFGGED